MFAKHKTCTAATPMIRSTTGATSTMKMRMKLFGHRTCKVLKPQSILNGTVTNMDAMATLGTKWPPGSQNSTPNGVGTTLLSVMLLDALRTLKVGAKTGTTGSTS